MLQMVPLDEDQTEETQDQPKSATQFFSVPSSKKKKPKPPSDPGMAGQGALPGAGAGSLPPGAPPGGSLPPGGSMVPGMAPPGGSMPPMGGGAMAISGPVAAGPVATGGSMAPGASPFQVAQQPDANADSGDRARSYRVYAIVLGLFAMTFMAMIVGVVALWFGFSAATGSDDDGTSDASTEETTPRDDKPKSTIDTAAPPEPIIIKPPPTAPRAPRAPSAPAAPKEPPPPPVAATANATFSIPSGIRYTNVEVTCPSGFRKRGAFSGTSATVPDVPTGEDCTAHFKGGAPAKASPVRGGKTYSCTFPSSVAVCK